VKITSASIDFGTGSWVNKASTTPSSAFFGVAACLELKIEKLRKIIQRTRQKEHFTSAASSNSTSRLSILLIIDFSLSTSSPFSRGEQLGDGTGEGVGKKQQQGKYPRLR